MDNILELERVSKRYRTRGKLRAEKAHVDAVNDVSFCVRRGESFGLVGESGCGKTTIAKLVTGIEFPDAGRLRLMGECDMVFQDPFSSLNPRMNVRQIIGEGLFVGGVKGAELEKRVLEMLELVHLSVSDAEKYPHQFSGGERQRIAIARALLRRPELLILDEPVSSLDVSIQAGILNLLKDLREELGLSMLFISHDMRVVEFMADVVAVMKAGRIVETGTSEDIYNAPRHEYTKMLMSVIPDPDDV